MDLQMKYQYTYFIYPYFIEKDKYSKYIQTLLNNKKCVQNTWKKENNIDLYNFFLPTIRKYVFNNFKEKLGINYYKDILKDNTILFNYKMEEDIQGKVGKEDGIFFGIQNINILCFKCGLCFMIFKTNVENSKKFSDVLNFNYKFRDINSNYSVLKEYENIKIQTDRFENMKQLTEFIAEITQNASKNNKIDTNRFYTYTYVCLEQESWEAENLEKEFVKLVNILPSNSNINIEVEEKDVLDNIKYTKVGMTEYGVTMLCSSIESKNYTNLPKTFENEYLYLYIIALYNKLYLKNIIENMKNKNSKEEYLNLEKELIPNNITNDESGNKLYNELVNVLKLNEIKQEITSLIDVEYKKLDIERTKKTNKIILVVLTISLILNIVNFIILIYR